MNCTAILSTSLFNCKSPGRESNISKRAYTEDDLSVAMYASLCRVLETAPVENKLPVFSLMGKCAAEEVSAFRQQMIDGLWEVAVGTGLVRQIGTASVQERLAIAFKGGVS